MTERRRPAPETAAEREDREERFELQVARVDQLVLAVNALSANLVEHADNLARLAIEAREKSAELRRRTEELDAREKLAVELRRAQGEEPDE